MTILILLPVLENLTFTFFLLKHWPLKKFFSHINFCLIPIFQAILLKFYALIGIAIQGFKKIVKGSEQLNTESQFPEAR